MTKSSLKRKLREAGFKVSAKLDYALANIAEQFNQRSKFDYALSDRVSNFVPNYAGNLCHIYFESVYPDGADHWFLSDISGH